MATKDVNKEKEDTTAPGAVSASENPNTDQQVEDKDMLQLVLESNQAVIESNNAVLSAIESFNENAKDVVAVILASAKGGGIEKSEKTKVVEISINKKATYVVAKGKKFQSSVTGEIITEGTELNGLETERLKSLVAQGIAVEKSED